MKFILVKKRLYFFYSGFLILKIKILLHQKLKHTDKDILGTENDPRLYGINSSKNGNIA